MFPVEDIKFSLHVGIINFTSRQTYKGKIYVPTDCWICTNFQTIFFFRQFQTFEACMGRYFTLRFNMPESRTENDLMNIV